MADTMKHVYTLIILFLFISISFIPVVSAIKDDEEFNKTAVEGIDKTMEIKEQLNSFVALGDKSSASMKAGNLRMNGQFYEMQLDRFETSSRLDDYVQALYNYFHGTYLYGYWYDKYINEVDSFTAVSMDDQEKYLDNARKSFDIAHKYLNETYPQAEPTPSKMGSASYGTMAADPFYMGTSRFGSLSV